MNKVKFVLFMAGILLALAFTFSCSSNINDGGIGGNVNEPSYNYCITADNICLTGPFTASTCNGQPSNTCPYGGSSSSVADGSSSSEYIPPPPPPSSSSEYIPPPPPPSSSSAGLCAGFVDGTPRMHYGRYKAQFCDSRDGKKYVYVTMGTQTWMAENLNYAADGSGCNGNIESNCTTYGRLYSWVMAMALPSDCINNNSCNSQIFLPHRGICPAGWHIPSLDEANRLLLLATTDDGKDNGYLRAASGWNGNGNGVDYYGFSALPGGCLYSNGSSHNARNFGAWWVASVLDNGNPLFLRIFYGSSSETPNYDDVTWASIRCVKD